MPKRLGSKESMGIYSNYSLHRQGKPLTEINQPTTKRNLADRTGEFANSNFKIQKQSNVNAQDDEKENGELKCLTNNCCEEKSVILNRKKISVEILTKQLAELQKVRLEMGRYGQNINCCEKRKLCPTLNSLLTKKVSRRELLPSSKTDYQVTDRVKTHSYTHSVQKSVIIVQESTFGADDETNEGASQHLSPGATQKQMGQSQHGEERGGPVLSKWKNKCDAFICEIKSLIDVCEKDPDYVLKSFKEVMGENKNMPARSRDDMASNKSYAPKHTFGDKFGYPEYHLLMVDSSTSIHKQDFTNPDFKRIAPSAPDSKQPVKIAQTVSIDAPEEDSGDDSVTILKSDTTIESELPVDIEPESKMLEDHGAVSEEQNVFELDEKSSKDKKGSIIFKEVSPDYSTEVEKRNSEMSSQSGSTAIESDTTSVDQVVEDATVKAENFRHNLEKNKQQSLVNIPKIENNLNNIKDDKPITPKSPKKKKLFNFRCFQKKKTDPDKKNENKETLENIDINSTSDEDSEGTLLKKPGHSSSPADNLKRRRSSSVEMTILKKNQQRKEFINNI